MARRNALDKEYFLEGNRQKWVGIGLIFILIILLCNIVYRIDPSPYLQGVMLLIGAGVLGWSVDSAVKAYRVGSFTQTTTDTQQITQDIKRDPKDWDVPLGDLYGNSNDQEDQDPRPRLDQA